MPCHWPTMPCFGGAELRTVFVTSLVRSGALQQPSPLDGAMFVFDGDARGMPPGRWQIGCAADAFGCQPQAPGD